MKLKGIVKLLSKQNKTLATMESCTGGAIVNAFTNIDGSSNVIKYSAVTYSNEYKIKMGVDKDIIDKYTVYSMEVADEMSKAISLFACSDYGIGITGKLNKVDKSNPYGSNNIVFVSIYDRSNNKFYNSVIKVLKGTRSSNKEIILNKIIELLSEVI